MQGVTNCRIKISTWLPCSKDQRWPTAAAHAPQQPPTHNRNSERSCVCDLAKLEQPCRRSLRGRRPLQHCKKVCAQEQTCSSAITDTNLASHEMRMPSRSNTQDFVTTHALDCACSTRKPPLLLPAAAHVTLLLRQVSVGWGKHCLDSK